MDIQENIVNKVAQSGLITIDLANYAPKEDIVIYDIKDNLFHGLILKEKDFREFIKNHDWSQYANKHVGIICSTDAIVPTWAYMLLANILEPNDASEQFAGKQTVLTNRIHRALSKIAYEDHADQRVDVRCC